MHILSGMGQAVRHWRATYKLLCIFQDATEMWTKYCKNSMSQPTAFVVSLNKNQQETWTGRETELPLEDNLAALWQPFTLPSTLLPALPNRGRRSLRLGLGRLVLSGFGGSCSVLWLPSFAQHSGTGWGLESAQAEAWNSVQNYTLFDHIREGTHFCFPFLLSLPQGSTSTPPPHACWERMSSWSPGPTDADQRQRPSLWR